MHKIKAEWTLLIIVFALFSLPLLFQPVQETPEKSATHGQELSETSRALPVRLVIPAINVNANVQHIGVTAQGEMEVPSNTVEAGWFKLGSRPGEMGSAVISGHFNGKNGETGVFTNLHKLVKGDEIFVQDDKGATSLFIVRETRIYDPGYAEEVFSLSDGVHLNLITCDGVWDGARESYSKRLVVFTDIKN